MGCPGRPFRDHRQVLKGIIYRFGTGVPWRDLPTEFGPWQTVWKRHRRFSLDGTYDRLLTDLQVQADVVGERLAGVGRLDHRSGAPTRRDRAEIPVEAHLAPGAPSNG